MKAYNVIFELCEYQPEVRIKFSDVMNFIKYFNKKILELSVNQVFDNFKIIFLDKHDHFRKAHIKTNRLKKNRREIMKITSAMLPRRLYAHVKKNTKFFQSCLDMRARATK